MNELASHHSPPLRTQGRLTRLGLVCLSALALLIGLASAARLLYNSVITPAQVPYFAYAPEYKLTIKRPAQWDLSNLLLFNSGNRKLTVLADWTGKELFRWHSNQAQAELWFDTLASSAGSLYAFVWGKYLEKLSPNSEQEWILPGAFVHALTHHPELGIVAVQRDITPSIEWHSARIQLVDDYLCFPEDSQGQLAGSSKRIGMLQFLLPWIEPKKIAAMNGQLTGAILTQKELSESSLLDLNTVKLIRKDITGIALKGDLLLYFSQVASIGIFAPKEMRMRSMRRLELKPSEVISDIALEPSGQLVYLVKDFATQRMRVERFDIATDRVVQEILATEDGNNVFTATRGKLDFDAAGQLWLTVSDLGLGFVYDRNMRQIASLRHEAAYGGLPGVSLFRPLQESWFTPNFLERLAVKAGPALLRNQP